MKKSFEDILRDMKSGETLVYEPAPDLEKRTHDLAHQILALEARVERLEGLLAPRGDPAFR